MSRDRDGDQLNQDGQFSLDAILAEFGSGQTPEPREETPVASDAPAASETEEGDWREDTIPFPLRPSRPPQTERPAQPKVLEFPGTQQPEAEQRQEPAAEGIVAEGLEELRRKADDFAGHMFEEEGSEREEQVRRAEKLIPGVDVERPAKAVRERRPRKLQPPEPDRSPAELTKRYAKGMKGLRLRTAMVLLFALLEVWLTAVHTLPPQLTGGLALESEALRCYGMALFQAMALLLGADAAVQGVVRLFRGRTGMDTLIIFANLFSLLDAAALPALSEGEIVRRPFCAVGVLSLWCVMQGSLQKRRGQRMACRTAASASEPYLVSRDEGKWNGKDTYAKWSGPVTGFGSQIQAEDGAERIYRVAVPLLMTACLLFALIASVGRGRPKDLLWCLAAIFSAAGPLSATFCFGSPWRRLCRRLNKSGAALAGWQGVVNTTGSANLLLTDIDLFPQGSVTLNGVKIFGNFPIDKVVAVTATAIRDAGSGLEKVFYDLLRSQGTLYRRGEEFTAHEGGGVSETIRGEQILVGSASFMVLMDVALPPGLKVKNAVFCAIDGELAGIFALNYHLPNNVPYAIDSLIRNRITPVLCTRDFNLIPSMLRQRFKLPAEKMEFPPVERRRELSDKDQDHDANLTAVLCREGVGPFAEAVVGGRRLRAAVRLSAALACLGSAVGALLAFYLASVAAYASLTPMNLLLFLLMWLVPVPLISGWVDRY